MMGKVTIILLLIVILAAVVRGWGIFSVPPGLTWDEAALGYNAYSLLQTGKDEYGTLLPLNLKSFGDFKPALYAYIDIPFVAILGLNELAVRLPSVIFGVGLVVLVYFLAVEIFKNRVFGLLSALMLAISPLAIQFSRPAFETNIALFFNVLATLLFLHGLKRPSLIIFSALLFGLSMFIYQASRLFVPALLIGLFLIYRQEIRFNRFLNLGMLFLFAFFILLGVLMLRPGQTNRLATMNFFAYTRAPEQVNLISVEDGLNKGSLNFQILHGEWFAYLRGFFERYLIYFSPKMLFIDGDYSPRHRVPDLGVLSYASILFVPLGLFYLLGLVFSGAHHGARLTLFWLLLAPLPAVLSRDLISMMRAFNILLPLTILEGAGLYWIFLQLRRYNLRVFYAGTVLICLLISGNFFVFLDRYFVHAPKEYSNFWLYGYKEVMQFTQDLIRQKEYDHIVITDFYGQPYIYYLFYTAYPPVDFQKQAVLEQPTVDVGTVRNIDNTEFRHIYWPADRGLKNSLFIGSKEELPDQDIIPFAEYKILKEVKFLDGLPAFRIVETK